MRLQVELLRIEASKSIGVYPADSQLLQARTPRWQVGEKAAFMPVACFIGYGNNGGIYIVTHARVAGIVGDR